MAEEYLGSHDNHRAHARAAEREHQSHHSASTSETSRPQTEQFAQGLPASALRGGAMSKRGNTPMRASALTDMQQTYGNRAVQRVIQRLDEETYEHIGRSRGLNATVGSPTINLGSPNPSVTVGFRKSSEGFINPSGFVTEEPVAPVIAQPGSVTLGTPRVRTPGILDLTDPRDKMITEEDLAQLSDM